ncbi:class I tRNA ligase family protein, partial [Treponema lecithinolyticum]
SENEANGGTDDFKTFYPTSTLVTAYDIIFFWVSRMIMAALEFTGKVPFKDIYIHGLVRDKQGRKMSKSLGNGIDPLEIIDSYGSDALKFTLAFMCAQGQDVLVDKESFKMGSRFANKVWNASRYILGNLEGRSFVDVAQKDLNELDCWIYDRLNAAVKRTRAALEGYRYNEAAQTVYEYFWNDFCDWYVEGTKLSFRSENEAEKDRAVSVLIHVLEESLRLLHPFLPFVTEEIYSFLPIEQKDKSLIRAPYPVERAERQNKTVEQRFTVLQNLIRSVRALRIECGIAPELKISLALLVTANSHAEVCREKTDLIRLLAGVKNIDFVNEKPPLSVGTVGDGFEAFILVQDGIDKEQLKARFQKALDTEQGFIAKSDAKLSGKFAQNAPPEVVEAEKEKRNASVHRAEKLKQYIQSL